jgi:hypothetical protein
LQRAVCAAASVVAVLGAGAFLPAVPQAQAAAPPAPRWALRVTPDADYFLPGEANKHGGYEIEAENVGDAPTSGEVTLEDFLSSRLHPFRVEFYFGGPGAPTSANVASVLCPTLAKCATSFAIEPGERLGMLVHATASSAGPLLARAKVTGGGATTVEASAANEANSEPAFGIDSFLPLATDSSANAYTQAGGHPFQLTTDFNFASRSSVSCELESGISACNFASTPVRDPRDLHVDLPPGLIGNPGGVPRCPLADYFARECPPSTAVGAIGIGYAGPQVPFTELGALYNLVPAGEVPGALGFNGLFPYILTASLRSSSDYGLTITNAATPEAAILRIRTTVWGVPADPAHNGLRGKSCLFAGELETKFIGSSDMSGERAERQCEHDVPGSVPAEVPPTPFLTMPTDCSGEPLATDLRSNSWQLPNEEAEARQTLPAVDGCNQLSFEPEIEARPTTTLADSPSGFDFNLTVPQEEDPEGVATPELREAVVTLPPGLTVNPSSANGLGACSPAQVGMLTPVGTLPAHFDEAPATCPDAAKLGEVEVNTSLLREPLLGSIYLATPDQNPSGSLLAGYIVLEGQGLVIKLAGKFESDPQSGQITASFTENPQTPFEEFKFHFFEGARGALRTPATCGSYQTTATLTPFSAPESGPAAEPSAEFETTVGAGGGVCPNTVSEEPNAPRFHAGTESPQAGAFSPFGLKLVREDGSQELAKIETTLPPGLVGKLAGIAECSDAQLAAAAAKSGQAEQASPSCPAASEVGTVDVAAGAGPTPLHVQGHAYLAGPYKGAPLSLAIVTPAVAGPFDLGTVVVRTALYVDPFTAQIKAVSDPIPHLLQGIPLDVRSITLKMGRPNFTLNPTNCEELGFNGSATSVLGQAAPLTQRFQVGGCAALPFKPKLSLRLKGSPRRAQFPSLTATLTMPPGDANVASAQVTLPHSSFLAQAHIDKTCGRPQLASHTCPASSIYGHARAITPLLDHPLEGPVYLATGFGYKLPALVADLNGQIEVLLKGKVDTGRGDGIRNTFEVVPDAPVTKFTLHMFGGKKGLIVNSENLCGRRAKTKALARFTAQNGAAVELEPTVANSCGKNRRRGKGGKGPRGHHKRPAG